MADKELVRTLDYILNRCDEPVLDTIAAAIIRRRRNVAMFGSIPAIPDPRRLAEEITSQLNIEGSIESIKNSVKDYAVRIIKQQAPEITDRQIEELMRLWIPGEQSPEQSSSAQSIPRDLLISMIDQFVSFSLGRMEEKEDLALRRDIGPWPEKYWKAFPQVIRSLVTDFLKGEMDEADFNTRIGLALQMR